MADRRIHELARALYQGRLSRREFLRAATAIGVSATAIDLFLRGAAIAQAQTATPVATPGPVPPIVAQPCETCRWAGKSITIQTSDVPAAVPFDETRDEFEAATGAKLTVVVDRASRAFTKLIDDATSGVNSYHGSLIAMSWLGALAEGGFVTPIDDFYANDTGEFPAVDSDAEAESPRPLRSYGGKRYVMPYDSDGQILFYRRDLLADPTHRVAFRDAVGYDLPAPPQTWEQVRDIATYFNGKDNTMGGTVSGVALPLGPDGRMAEHFASLSAPYVIGPANTFRYWFDPDDMSPLCASQGHARAANMLKELARLGPATMTSWTLGDSWEYFVKGNAVFTYAWGGVTQLAIGQKQPTVGKIAAALPGTLAYVDPKTGQETKVDAPNLVGNTTGDSWAGVVMSSAPEPDLVYYLFALLATEPKQRFLAARVADGVNPGSVFQFPKPVGTGDIDDYLSQGWNEQDARDYTTALSNNYANKLQLPYLRIPGAERYWSALDNRLAEFLSDRVATAEAALQQVADDWNGITDDLDRESQRLSYLTTLGLPLPSSGD